MSHTKIQLKELTISDSSLRSQMSWSLVASQSEAIHSNTLHKNIWNTDFQRYYRPHAHNMNFQVPLTDRCGCACLESQHQGAKARRSRVLGHPRLHCEFLSKKIPQSQNLVMTILSNLKLGIEHRTSQIPDIQMWTIGYKRVQRHIILGIRSQCLTFNIETTDSKRSVSSYLLNML